MSVDLHRHQFSEHETQKVHVFEDEPVLFEEITAAPTLTVDMIRMSHVNNVNTGTLAEFRSVSILLLLALFDLFILGRPENYQPGLAEFRG